MSIKYVGIHSYNEYQGRIVAGAAAAILGLDICLLEVTTPAQAQQIKRDGGIVLHVVEHAPKHTGRLRGWPSGHAVIHNQAGAAGLRIQTREALK